MKSWRRAARKNRQRKKSIQQLALSIQPKAGSRKGRKERKGL
jgi:hypothetical protein